MRFALMKSSHADKLGQTIRRATRKRMDAVRGMLQSMTYDAAASQGLLKAPETKECVDKLLGFKPSDRYYEVNVGEHKVSVLAMQDVLRSTPTARHLMGRKLQRFPWKKDGSPYKPKTEN